MTLSTQPNEDKKHSVQIYGLDIIRFSAAFCVMVFHLGITNVSVGGHITQRAIVSWGAAGWVGVPIFFVISGFVIAYTANGRSPISFLNSRLSRLWPAMFICATIAVPILHWGGRPLRSMTWRYIRSLVFWPFPPWMASAYWTLSIELVFYAVIFVLLCWNAFKRIEYIGLALGLSSVSTWTLYFLPDIFPVSPDLQQLMMAPGNSGYARLLLLHHGCYFALGLFIWLSVVDGLTPRRVAWMLLFTMACFLQILSEAQKVAIYAYTINPLISIGYWFVTMILLASSIYWREPIARMFSRHVPLIRAIGLSTYPLYLVHEPIGVRLVAQLTAGGVSTKDALAVAIFAALALAFLVSLFAEPWLRHWFNRAILGAENLLAVLNGDSTQQHRTPPELAVLMRQRRSPQRVHHNKV